MSTLMFKGNPELGGLPRKSRVRVEALPKRHLIWEGVASDAVYIDLDPGKYAYSVVRKSHPSRIDDAIYHGEFLHEITESSWKALQQYSPRLFKGTHTSEGVRWRCQHPMCEDEYTTTTAALIHEMEHFGISREDFLANPHSAAAKAAGRRSEEFSGQLRDAMKRAGKSAPDPIPA